MDKSEYFNKLKDPRWQAKRLFIFERDKFECVSCGSKDKTLTVHHNYYEQNKNPWEYPDDSLMTLCEDCHKEAQITTKLLKESIKQTSYFDMEYIRGVVDITNNHGDEDGKFILTSWEYVYGLCTGLVNIIPEDIYINNSISMKKIYRIQASKGKIKKNKRVVQDG